MLLIFQHHIKSTAVNVISKPPENKVQNNTKTVHTRESSISPVPDECSSFSLHRSRSKNHISWICEARLHRGSKSYLMTEKQQLRKLQCWDVNTILSCTARFSFDVYWKCCSAANLTYPCWRSLALELWATLVTYSYMLIHIRGFVLHKLLTDISLT